MSSGKQGGGRGDVVVRGAEIKRRQLTCSSPSSVQGEEGPDGMESCRGD